MQVGLFYELEQLLEHPRTDPVSQVVLVGVYRDFGGRIVRGLDSETRVVGKSNETTLVLRDDQMEWFIIGGELFHPLLPLLQGPRRKVEGGG